MSMYDRLKARSTPRYPDMELELVNGIKKIISKNGDLSGIQVSTIRNTEANTNLVIDYITGDTSDFLRYDTASLTLYTTESYKYANDLTICLSEDLSNLLDVLNKVSYVEIVDVVRIASPNEDTHIRLLDLDLIVKGV